MKNVRSRSDRTVSAASSNQYLYRSVTDELRLRIASGSYAQGMRIPSVDALAEEFGVSTITVRRAVRDLSLEGLLVGRQGRGTFVVAEGRIVRSIGADWLEPIEENMRAGGVTASLRDLGTSLVLPSEEPFLVSLSRRNRYLYRLERLLLADGKAVGLDTLWLPRELAAKLKDRLRGQFIISQLSRANIAIQNIRYQVEATTASEAQAAALNVVTGFPLLVIRFFLAGRGGHTLLVGRNITRGDRFTYQFTARPISGRAPPCAKASDRL